VWRSACGTTGIREHTHETDGDEDREENGRQSDGQEMVGAAARVAAQHHLVLGELRPKQDDGAVVLLPLGIQLRADLGKLSGA
jgi:hypothetical protein